MLRRDRVSSRPFIQHRTRDRYGRMITYYVASRWRSVGERPVVLFIQGSGCASLFRRGDGKQVRGGYQNVLFQSAGDRAVVVAVEKPGVEFLDEGNGGSARGCRDEFLREHTLGRWSEAICAVVDVCVDRGMGPILLAGHSEGAVVAAAAAVRRKDAVTHVAILAGSGPVQLADFLSAAPAASLPELFEEVDATWKEIAASPRSIDRFAWGHPYRRWSSFLSTSTVDLLSRSRARVFIAHGARDRVIPDAAARTLAAELMRRRRDVVLEVMPHANHSFCVRGEEPPAGMRKVFGRMMLWFEGS